MKAKKMLAFVLSFVMLFSVIGTAAPYTLETHAEEVQTYEELYYLGYNEDQVLPGEERYLGTGNDYTLSLFTLPYIFTKSAEKCAFSALFGVNSSII